MIEYAHLTVLYKILMEKIFDEIWMKSQEKLITLKKSFLIFIELDRILYSNFFSDQKKKLFNLQLVFTTKLKNYVKCLKLTNN